MADIKLKDASGNDQEYIGVNSVSFRSTTEGETVTFIAQQQVDWNQTDDTAVDFIKNKPQGLATESYVQEQIDAIGIQEGIATEAYVQEQIAKIEVSDSQVQVNWEQDDATAKDFIQNKPFGLVPAVLSPRTMQFETTEHNDILKMESVKTIKIIEGETYIITWGDNKQELIAKNNVAPNLTFLGNISILSPELGEDTEEPFLFYSGTVRENGVESDVLTCITNDLSVFTRVVGIEPVTKEKKLSAKWLPDGIATEDFVKEQIAAIEIPEGSGGSVSTEKVFLEETEIENAFSLEGLIGAQFPFTDYLNIGETYYVNWNGIEYEVTNAQDNTALMQNLISPTITKSIAMGNGEIFGLSGNNEPFMIITTGEVIMFADLSPEATVGGKNTVRIYQKTPLSVSWENVTDKPFYDNSIHIFVDHSTVDTNIKFYVEAIDAEFIKVSDNVLSKNELIGATFKGTFSDGTTQSAVISESEIQIEYDNGVVISVLGQVPVWTCYRPGEHTVSMDGTSAAFNVPEAGTYVISFAVEELAYSEFSKNEIKYLDNKYLSMLEYSGNGEGDYQIKEKYIPESFKVPEGVATETYVETYVQEKIDAIEIPEAEQVQANWNENDETSKAFIQNRPFYRKPDIYSKRTVSFSKSSNNNSYIGERDYTQMPDGENGKTYRVFWDDVEYICTSRSVGFTNGSLNFTMKAVLGNPQLWATDTISTSVTSSEPFAIVLSSYSYSSNAWMGDIDKIATSSTASSHTIRIAEADNVVKLPEEYLPEDIGKQSDWNETDETSKAFIRNKPIISNGALTTAKILALNNLFKIAAYTSNATDAYKEFLHAFDLTTKEISLNANNITLLIGDSQALVATVTPSSTLDELVWSTSNNSVATVSNGVVTAIAEGDCVITVTSGDCTASCNVTVTWGELVAELDKDDLVIGGLTSNYNGTAYATTGIPYMNARANRLSYVKFDIPAEANYQYKFVYEADSSIKDIGAEIFNTSVLQSVANSQNFLDANRQDCGWFANGTILTPNQIHNGYPPAAIRITFRKNGSTNRNFIGTEVTKIFVYRRAI